MTLAAMVGCAVLGVVIERFAYRPLRDAPRIAPLISALGVSFFLANSMQLLFGATPRNYDIFDLANASLYTKGFDIGNVHVALLRIITDRLGVRPDGAALVPRQPDAHRQGDARDVVRPRGGGDDGHRHRPRDRLHVRPRLGARRRRRRDVRAARADDRLDRLHRRAQGLHRGRDRRHRLDPRRDGRRPDPRLRRVVRAGLHLDEVVRSDRLLDPDRVHDLPAAGPPRTGGHPQG